MKILLLIGLIFSQARHLSAQISTDGPILLEILLNTVKQVNELTNLVKSTQEQLELAKQIREGLDDALGTFQRLSPPNDPGLYSDWREVGNSLTKLTALFGEVVDSNNADRQRSIDRSVAEAVTLNNKIFDYADELDLIATDIRSHSQVTSQKGAARLTAQSIGVLLSSNNQILRSRAAELKLLAEEVAMKNREDKEHTRQTLFESKTLSEEMNRTPTQFKTPRF